LDAEASPRLAVVASGRCTVTRSSPSRLDQGATAVWKQGSPSNRLPNNAASGPPSVGADPCRRMRLCRGRRHSQGPPRWDSKRRRQSERAVGSYPIPFERLRVAPSSLHRCSGRHGLDARRTGELLPCPDGCLRRGWVSRIRFFHCLCGRKPMVSLRCHRWRHRGRHRIMAGGKGTVGDGDSGGGESPCARAGGASALGDRQR